MTKKYSSQLFEGEYDYATGKFSTEEQLIRDCPHKFMNPANNWTQYGLQAVSNGVVDYTTWAWKTNDGELQDKQGRCFAGLLHSTRNLKNPSEQILLDRAAVLAWMLSKIVISTPEYRRPQRGPR